MTFPILVRLYYLWSNVSNLGIMVQRGVKTEENYELTN